MVLTLGACIAPFELVNTLLLLSQDLHQLFFDQSEFFQFKLLVLQLHFQGVSGGLNVGLVLSCQLELLDGGLQLVDDGLPIKYLLLELPVGTDLLGQLVFYVLHHRLHRLYLG